MFWMSYVFTAIPFVVMFAFGILLPLIVATAYRSAGVGIATIVFGYFLNTVFGQIGIRLPITLYVPDFTVGLIGLVAIIRIIINPSARPAQPAVYALLLVFLINLVHGLVVYKAAAGSSARPTFYALATFLYFSTFPANRQTIRALFNGIAAIALAYFMLAVYRGTLVVFDVRELLPRGGSYQPPGHSIWRVISSSESLLVAQAMLTFWAFAAIAPGWRQLKLLAPILILATLALQHRSVWLASIVGYLVFRISLSGRTLDKKALISVALVLLGVVGLGLLAAGRGGGGAHGGGVGADVAKSAQDAVELRGTAGERLGSWGQIVKQWASDGPRRIVLGQPYGTSMERYTSDDLGARRISYQPHNYYVELLSSTGLVGLVSYLFLLFGAALGLWRKRADPDHGLAARWLLMMIAFQMTYYLTYGVDYLQSAALGVAVSMVWGHAGVARRQTIATPKSAFS